MKGNLAMAVEPNLEMDSIAERQDQLRMAAVSTLVTLVLLAGLVTVIWRSWSSNPGGSDEAVAANAASAAPPSRQAAVNGGGGATVPATTGQLPQPVPASVAAPRIHIAGSYSEVAAQTLALERENRRRLADGQREIDASIVLFVPGESDAEEDGWRMAIAGENRVRAGLGLPEVELVDLRTPAATQGSDQTITVYLVRTQADVDVLLSHGLRPNEIVLAAGTVEESIRAAAILQSVGWHDETSRVTVVDLRAPAVADSPPGSSQETPASVTEPSCAAGEAPCPTG
jgi:hypothetical protein